METDHELIRKEDYEAICGQIERDDPEIEEFTIIDDPFFPKRGEWERVGRAIGGNTHIKELIFPHGLEHWYDDLGGEDEFAAFCKSFACNESIEQLHVSSIDLYDGKIFDMLSPFLEQNHNLRCLSVDCSLYAPDKLRFLSETLTRFNSLKEFVLTGNFRVATNPETTLRALKGHSKLSVITFIDSDFSGSASLALESLLIEHYASLTEVDLSFCSFDGRGGEAVANAFAYFRALKKCRLSHNKRIGTDGWVAILYKMSRFLHSSLEELDLSGNAIADVAVDFLCEAMRKCKNLRTLKLARNRHITAEQWQLLFPILLGPRRMLQDLRLGWNEFTDEAITSLIDCLTNNCTLESLDLNGNYTVTSSGWRAFSAVLRNTGSALKAIDISYCSIDPIDDATLATYSESLIGNCTLEQLIMIGSNNGVGPNNGRDDARRFNALAAVLCDKASIVGTFHSNHTLQRISTPGESSENDESHLPHDLKTLLQINRNNSRAEAARHKIIDAHFTGAFSMKPFFEMNPGILHHALAWMAKSGYGRSLLYEFLRSTNFFFGVGLAMESDISPRRKRLKTR